MPLEANTTQPTAGDRLDVLFAQIAVLEVRAEQLMAEINKPNISMQSYDALMDKHKAVLAEMRPLTKETCQIVADATV